MAALSNALTTLERAKLHLGVTDNASNLILTMMILSATSFVQKYTRRIFKKQTYTQEMYNGKGSKHLWLNQTNIDHTQPVIIQERRSKTGDAWTTLASKYLRIDYNTGKITRLDQPFHEGEQNYRATYTAGYLLPADAGYQDGTNDQDDLPYELELFVLDMVKGAWTEREADGVSKEKVGEVEIWYDTKVKQSEGMQNTLNRYRRMSYA